MPPRCSATRAKVRFTPLTAAQRFTALQTGEIDVLSRVTTITFQRDVQLGIEFPAINWYDGTGFIVRKSLNVKSVKDLNGATICVQPGTTNELDVADYFRKHHLTFTPVVIERLEEATNAYFAGRCDAFSQDQSTLAAVRARAPNPAEHVVLPEVISKAPYGPGVMPNDLRWMEIVRWSVFAMIDAEELGLSSTTIDRALASDDPDVQRFVGKTGGFGAMLGLDADWAFGSSNRSATTPRASIATSSRSASTAASTACGRTAASSTSRTCVDSPRRRSPSTVGADVPGATRERAPSSGRSLRRRRRARSSWLVAMQTAANLRARGIASGFDYLGRAAGFEISRGPARRIRRATATPARSRSVSSTRFGSSLLGIAHRDRARAGDRCRAALEHLGRLDDGERVRRGHAQHAAAAAAAVLVFAVAGAARSARRAEPASRACFSASAACFCRASAWHDGYRWIVDRASGARRLRFSRWPSISPEFAALLIGLSTYTAAFIGEIVRGGILAVDRGQTEAAAALGLSRGQHPAARRAAAGAARRSFRRRPASF